MFGDVFPDVSGRLRGPTPNYIHQNVTLGSFARGVHADDVPQACEVLAEQVQDLVRQLDERQISMTRSDFQEQVLKAGAYLHCEIVRIHPFVNGNGRVARECINYLAYRYGATALPVERPRDEYIAAIQTWISHRNIEHFTDFLRPQWLVEPE